MLDKVNSKGVVVFLLILLISLVGYLGYDKYSHRIRPDVYDNLTPGPIVNAKADIVIEGPTEIKIGQLAKLDVTKSTGKTFKWKVLPPNTEFVTYDDGRKAVFSTGTAGEYIFIVACANDNDVDVKTFTVKVGDVVPNPAPVPPSPVNPATGFTGKVVDFTKLVNSPNKKAEAGKLAGGFTSVLQQIQGGQLTTAEQIVEAQKIANRSALGNNLTSWLPFLEALQKEMKSQAELGLLVTAEQHATIWKQIAEGLNLVAK
jgi:hypothetical protein